MTGKGKGMIRKELIVYPYAPYDMERVMLKLGADPQYDLNWERKELTFPVRVRVKSEEEGKKTIVTLSNLGTVDEPCIKVMMQAEALNQEHVDGLLQHVTDRFQWKSEQLHHFYAAMRKDERLHWLVQQYRGLPLVLDEGIYEGLLKTIVHQQLNLKFAQQLVVTLAKEYGDRIMMDEREYYFFPTAEQMIRIPIEELRTKKFSQRKAESITAIARKVVSGELDLEALSAMSNEQVIETLTKERGIGVWTAECVLLFCLARPNLFPAGDIGIRDAIQRLERLEQRPTIEECREWVKPYQQWGSYLALYLWEYRGNHRLKTGDVK